jgi:hypothetical protein
MLHRCLIPFRDPPLFCVNGFCNCIERASVFRGIGCF